MKVFYAFAVFCLLVLVTWSCSKVFKEDDVCQPIKPENNALIKKESFLSDGNGYIRDLSPSPDGNLFYILFASDNVEKTAEYFQIVIGGLAGEIDSSKIRAAGAFRYEFGELTTSGFKKSSLYFPDYFIPQNITPINYGARRGDVIISGRFLNIFTAPYNFDWHLYIYNHNTRQLEDLLSVSIGPLEVCYKSFSEQNSSHEMFLTENNGLYRFTLDDNSNQVSTTLLANLGFYAYELNYAPKGGDDFILAESSFYRLPNGDNEGYYYSNLYKILVPEQGELQVYPLLLSGGVPNTGNIKTDGQDIYCAGIEIAKDVKIVGAYGSSYTYVNSLLQRLPLVAESGSEAEILCQADNSKIYCNSDFEFNVNSSKNPNFKVSWSESTGDVLLDADHCWQIGSTSRKTYNYEKNGEVLEKPIGVAYINSVPKSGGDCRRFTFGEEKSFCYFNCGAIVGNTFFAGGSAPSGQAWLVSFALDDLK